MTIDKVCWNGTLGDFPADAERLLGTNYIHQAIHTLEHRPLHLGAHLDIAAKSYRTLYGADPDLDEATVRDEIERTLAANRYPRISNLVSLYVVPPAEPGGAPARFISCAGPMLYKGYVLWHARPQATVRTYDYPTAGHPTALARISHRQAAEAARRKGFEAVIRTAGGAGGLATLIDADGWPLFAVRGGQVFTAPLAAGATESVPRRIGYRLCELAGVDCTGAELPADELTAYDELFYLNPQGIVSILSCDGHILYNLVTLRLAAVLERLDPAEYNSLL